MVDLSQAQNEKFNDMFNSKLTKFKECDCVRDRQPDVQTELSWLCYSLLV